MLDLFEVLAIFGMISISLVVVMSFGLTGEAQVPTSRPEMDTYVHEGPTHKSFRLN
jgi:hypothetical protein